MTAKDLKKPHISRQVGELESWRYGEMQRGTETQCGEERWQWRKGWPQIHKWWTKIGRDTLGARDPNPSPDKSHKFLTVKTSGGWGGRRNGEILRSHLLKVPQQAWDLDRLTPSRLQCRGSSWKGNSGMWGKIEVSGIRANARRQLPPGQNSRGQASALTPF